jgi:hypothetical protein
MVLNVSLRAMQWELTLQVLRKGPYEVVAPIIDDIQRQCMARAMPHDPLAQQARAMPQHLPNQGVNQSGMLPRAFHQTEASDG